jgi:hypothetical protein
MPHRLPPVFVYLSKRGLPERQQYDLIILRLNLCRFAHRLRMAEVTVRERY